MKDRLHKKRLKSAIKKFNIKNWISKPWVFHLTLRKYSNKKYRALAYTVIEKRLLDRWQKNSYDLVVKLLKEQRGK